MITISFEIIRDHCFILATTRNLHTCVCFYVIICLNKNKSLVRQNLKSFLDIGRNNILQIKIYKVKGKKVFNQTAAKAKNVELAKALLKLLVAFLEPIQTSKMELFVKIVNG